MFADVPVAESPGTMRRHRIVRRGFQLTVLVCGRPGTGKATFINTLCEADVYKSNDHGDSTYTGRAASQSGPNGIVRKQSIRVDDPDGSSLSLTFYDVPGFGRELNSTNCINAVRDLVDTKFRETYTEEMRVHRNPRLYDELVHVCLYFVPPVARLTDMDIQFLQAIAPCVNVIPIIGRADCLSASEKSAVKVELRAQLHELKIPVYSFVASNEFLDTRAAEEAKSLQHMLPFAAMGSCGEYIVNGAQVRGRSYAHGFAALNDERVSDFVTIRNVLLGTHLEEFRERTQTQLYEKFRAKQLHAAEQSRKNKARQLSPRSQHTDHARTLDPLWGDQHALELLAAPFGGANLVGGHFSDVPRAVETRNELRVPEQSVSASPSPISEPLDEFNSPQIYAPSVQIASVESPALPGQYFTVHRSSAAAYSQQSATFGDVHSSAAPLPGYRNYI